MSYRQVMANLYTWAGLFIYGMGVYILATEVGPFYVFIPPLLITLAGLGMAFTAGYAIWEIEFDGEADNG